jgi:hypothetical protein
MTNIIEFKTDRVRSEWDNEQLNDKLKNIIILLAFYSWNFFQKKLTITEIFRTQDEQDRYYRDNEKYKKKPWASVHMFYRGIDLRTKYYDDVEIKTLLKIANTIPYDLNKPSKKTLLYHDVGKGKHLHAQTYL